MDFDTYRSLGLDTRFEDKPRSKRDSGMDNINGGPDARKQLWKSMLAAEDAARRKYPMPDEAEPRQQAPPGRLIEYKAWTGSSTYPGTLRNWSIWVPAQCDGTKPANIAIFNDGSGFLHSQGAIRATVVMANLIADGRLDPTVAVFIDPGIRQGHPDCAYDRSDPPRAVADDPQRSLEYDSVSDVYSRFLIEDILPVVESQVRLTTDPAGRAVVGISSGAVGAFCAAWFRPDVFGLAASACGSFVNIRGAHNLPWVIRNTARKPLKVFLQSGERDMSNSHGSWPLANREMAAALEYAGYRHRLVFGTGGHGLVHMGSIFPSMLEWLFKGGDVAFAEEQSGESGRSLVQDRASRL